MAVFFIVVLLIGTCVLPFVSSQRLYRSGSPISNVIDGQILVAPMWDTTTYLIDSTGALTHTWSSNFLPGVAALWLGNGTILRTIRDGVGPGTGGTGGGVQKVGPDSTVEWDFRYNANGNLSHHDIMMLPNGNVLMIAWESKTQTEAIAAGRNPSYVTTQGLWPDHIIEVKPTGPTSGDIVWEWHVWDHLIQDYDSSKANYGVIANHPELVNINYVTSSGTDLMHTNSIDYNEQFDQILISVLNYNEIWVIDHSTTTEEAAGHTGGHSGKGGDLLYRWGNPQTYDAGTSSDEKLFNQHDASWIHQGLPGAGDLLIFNNGGNRRYSTIDEIVPPVNESGGYHLEPGSAYGPAVQTWMYAANPPTSFYVSHLGGAQRLASGDTLICNGLTGKIFEVTPQGSTVWQHSVSQVFKVEYIPSGTPEPPPGNTTAPNLECTGSLSWTDVQPGATVHGSFQVQNVGAPGSSLNWTVNNSLPWGNWTFAPSSGENLSPEDGPVTVQVSIVAPDQGKTEFQGYVKVENRDNASDFSLIPVYMKTSVKLIFYLCDGKNEPGALPIAGYFARTAVS